MDHETTSINPLKWDDKYTIYFFLKVSILTLVFSICRMILFPPEHERYTHLHDEADTPGNENTWTNVETSNNEVNSLIKAIVDESLSPTEELEHNSSYFSTPERRFDEICSVHRDICSITTRDGSYTANEKLMYQAILIYMINVLNDYLDTTMQKNIQYVKLYEDSDRGSRRWSATATYVKMNTAKINDAKEFRQVLTHELGHMIDFSVVTWYSRTKDTRYTEFWKARWPVDDPSINYYKISWLDESTRRSSANFRDFVSGYGMRWMYEDMAEFHNLWLNHHAYLKSLVRWNETLEAKYDYFSALYGRNYFNDTYTTYPDPWERVWDTTNILDN